MRKYINIAPYVGMVLLQCASLPAIVSTLNGVGNYPPASMIWMVWGGLLLYMVHAIADKLTPYIVSNGLGIALNSLLLILIYL